jgi:hypothetical protein
MKIGRWFSENNNYKMYNHNTTASKVCEEYGVRLVALTGGSGTLALLTRK